MSSLFGKENDTSDSFLNEILSTLAEQSINEPSTTRTSSTPQSPDRLGQVIDWVRGTPGPNPYRDSMLRGAARVGSTFSSDFSPEVLSDTLNRLRNAATSDPASFSKQVAGYTGKTITDPRVVLSAMGLGGIGAGAAGTALPKVIGDMLLASGFTGTVGEGLNAVGAPELEKVRANASAKTKEEKAVDAGEAYGPRYELSPRGARTAVAEGKIAYKGDTPIPWTDDERPGSLSKYKQSSNYEAIVNPAAEAAANKMYLDAKNDVYGRYKEAFKAAANNPGMMTKLQDMVEKQASEEAIRVVPKQYRDRIAQQLPKPEEKKTEEAQPEEGFWSAAKGPLLMGAVGIAAALLAKKLITPQQAEQLAAMTGEAPLLKTAGAAALSPNTTNVAEEIGGAALRGPKATPGSLSKVSSKITPQGYLPNLQKALPNLQKAIPDFRKYLPFLGEE